MNAESYAYKVFSAEKIPPLNSDAVLGIQDNQKHPRFTPIRHAEFEAAHVHLVTAIANIESAYAELNKANDIDLQPLRLSYALTNSLKYIIEQAFFVNAGRVEKPKNGLVGL